MRRQWGRLSSSGGKVRSPCGNSSGSPRRHSRSLRRKSCFRPCPSPLSALPRKLYAGPSGSSPPCFVGAWISSPNPWNSTCPSLVCSLDSKVGLPYRRVSGKPFDGTGTTDCCESPFHAEQSVIRLRTGNMYRNIKANVYDSYRKNKDDFRAFLFRIYPEFIYKEVEKIPLEEIPVFTFHSVEPETFEEQIRYLAENRYRTVTGDKFFEIITGKVKNEENTIVLTFDDGVGSLWSVVYPVLKKYGLSAISFILPSRIMERSQHHSTLQNFFDRKAAIEEIHRKSVVYGKSVDLGGR